MNVKPLILSAILLLALLIGCAQIQQPHFETPAKCATIGNFTACVSGGGSEQQPDQDAPIIGAMNTTDHWCPDGMHFTHADPDGTWGCDNSSPTEFNDSIDQANPNQSNNTNYDYNCPRVWTADWGSAKFAYGTGNGFATFGNTLTDNPQIAQDLCGGNPIAVASNDGGNQFEPIPLEKSFINFIVIGNRYPIIVPPASNQSENATSNLYIIGAGPAVDGEQQPTFNIGPFFPNTSQNQTELPDGPVCEAMETPPPSSTSCMAGFALVDGACEKIGAAWGAGAYQPELGGFAGCSFFNEDNQAFYDRLVRSGLTGEEACAIVEG